MPMRDRGKSRTMLTQELADSLVLGVRQKRVFDSQNAIAHGVHPTTLKTWLRKGLLIDAEEPYRSFAERYSKEQIADEEDAVAELRACALPFHGDDKFHKPGDWRAAAWYLERKYPRRWALERQNASGPSEAIDVEGILVEGEQQPQQLGELLTNPPPELVAAMRENRESIRALLAAFDEDDKT